MGLVHGVPKGGTVWEVPFARARSALFFASFFNRTHFVAIIEHKGYYLDKSDNQHQAYVNKNKRNPEQSCGISDIFSCVKHTVFPL